jgi:AcrR family transcriptional regulator
MSPRSAASSEKRARILEAAYRVCERHGVDGARMEEVAARARVSKGTLYRYFASKEHLLLATILDSYERALPLVESGDVERLAPRERLEVLLEGLVKVLEAVAPRMSVHYQAWGLVAKDPELEERLFRFLREFHEARGRTLEETVREGQRDGVFPPDADPETFADAIQALLSGFLYRATFHPERASAAGLRGAFAALVLDVLGVPGAPGDGAVRG